MVKANGTFAKDIAIHFLNSTTDRYTSSMVGKTIIQAKQLLESGYTKEEIISAIDYVVNNTKVEMYSLGYINTCINDILKDVQALNNKQLLREKKKKLEEEYQAIINKDRGEVFDESTNRNRDKFRRLNIQSRQRKKSPFDLLKE